MIRKIIKIDETKCNGCGACASACHEGAIGIVNGIAKLMREDYCDGLGDCLPACPTNAISFVEREAPVYDEQAVLAAKVAHAPKTASRPQAASPCTAEPTCTQSTSNSFLSQWPVQIKLVPIQAPFFDGADLLIAADCSAYAYARFHEDFIRGRVTLIGCPKLDEGDYSEKLTQIFTQNEIQSITITRMTVPCCGGLEYAVKTALKNSGRQIPCQTVIISPNGQKQVR